MKKILFHFAFYLTLVLNVQAAIHLTVTTDEYVNLKLLRIVHPQFSPIYPLVESIEKGMITLNFQAENESFYVLQVDNFAQQCFLRPGDSYNIKIKNDSVLLWGDQLNNALLVSLGNYKKFTFNDRHYYDWDESDFEQAIKSCEESLLAGISDSIFRLNISEKEIVRNYISSLISAKIFNFYQSELQPRDYSEYNTPDFFEAYLKNFQFDTKQLQHGNSTYLMAAISKFEIETGKVLNPILRENPNLPYDEILDILVSSAKSDDIPAMFQALFISDIYEAYILASSDKNLDVKLKNFREAYPGNPYSEEIEKIYNHKLSLEKSSDSHELPCLNIDAAQSEIFKSFENNILYIDFWATWCGPCIKSFPDITKLESDYGDKLKVIKVSVDRDFKKWQNFLHSKGIITGDNFIITPDKVEEVSKEFQLSSVPRYMLVNKDGRIINANAPPPSDPKLKELLDELLMEK